MKKTIDIARLVIFFLAGIGLYFYMNTAIAAQKQGPKSILHMSPLQSYKIWNAVNKLEESWYVKDSPRLQLAPLDTKKELKLRTLTQDYTELKPLVLKLLIARKKGDWDAFFEMKEKIAEQLRPIWSIATREMWKEEAKNQGLQAWLRWFKSKIQNATDNIYLYFFPVQKPVPQAPAPVQEPAAPQSPAPSVLQNTLPPSTSSDFALAKEDVSAVALAEEEKK